jgi:hypothetical protein
VANSTYFTNQIRSGTKETDGEVFIEGFNFAFDVGTWTFTRSALGNYFMRKTAAANVSHPAVDLGGFLSKKIGPDPQSIDAPHDIRGFQVTQISVVYGIGTAALNAHSGALQRATYANNAAVVLTSPSALTGALATATQANPYVTAQTVNTPFVVGNNVALVNDWYELTVDAAATSVYDLYGIFVAFNYNIL